MLRSVALRGSDIVLSRAGERFPPPTRNEHDASRFIFLPGGPTLKCSKVNEDLVHADGRLDGKFSSCGNRRNLGKGRGVGKQPRKKEGKVL